MIVTFCGHSTYIPKCEDETKVLQIVENHANGENIEFYLGGYGNFDFFAKKCAEKYKSIHKNTKIVFVTPYINDWLNERRDYFENEYDEIIYPELESVPFRFAISKRNEWMAEHSDLVIAYVCVDFGGAYAFFKHAIRCNKEVVNIAELGNITNNEK